MGGDKMPKVTSNLSIRLANMNKQQPTHEHNEKWEKNT